MNNNMVWQVKSNIVGKKDVPIQDSYIPKTPPKSSGSSSSGTTKK